MIRAWFFAFAIFLQSDVAVQADELDLTSRPSPEGVPIEVSVRMIILNIEQIRGAEQSFTADIAFQAEWEDDRLKHEGKGQITKDLSDIWHPGFQILNRQRIQTTFPEDAEISADGSVNIMQRAWGQFSQPLQLIDFPFDTQALRVTLVSPGHEEGAIVLKEDADSPSRTNNNFSISDWAMVDWKSETSNRPVMAGERSIPTFEATITMKRNSRYYFINVILPLFLIICMSWIVFWIPSSQMGPRISVSVTAMLTLTAYRFAIGASLPKIAYLTRLDWFILGSSVLVFVSLVEVVVTSSLVEKDKEALARRINRSMRFLAPAMFLVVAVLSLF